MANGVKSAKKKIAPPPRPIAITPHFDFEREAFRSGHRWVAGADEVGRGPLAGPVGVAAVILDPDDLPEGLDNSKVLQAPARKSLCRPMPLLPALVSTGVERRVIAGLKRFQKG